MVASRVMGRALKGASPNGEVMSQGDYPEMPLPHKRRSALEALPSTLNPDVVLTFNQWTALNGISARTGRRILNSGRGPTVTQLSAKRIGITVANNRAWQASRERA